MVKVVVGGLAAARSDNDRGDDGDFSLTLTSLLLSLGCAAGIGSGIFPSSLMSLLLLLKSFEGEDEGEAASGG